MVVQAFVARTLRQKAGSGDAAFLVVVVCHCGAGPVANVDVCQQDGCQAQGKGVAGNMRLIAELATTDARTGAKRVAMKLGAQFLSVRRCKRIGYAHVRSFYPSLYVAGNQRPL